MKLLPSREGEVWNVGSENRGRFDEVKVCNQRVGYRITVNSWEGVAITNWFWLWRWSAAEDEKKRNSKDSGFELSVPWCSHGLGFEEMKNDSIWIYYAHWFVLETNKGRAIGGTMWGALFLAFLEPTTNIFPRVSNQQNMVNVPIIALS